MNCLRIAHARLFGLLRKSRLDEEIEEELRFHLAMQTEANIARGMSAEEAKQAATRQFGNVGRIKEEWRDVSGGGLLEVLLQDVRFAVRMLRKDRAFTVAAVLALALGIAANTALFTVVSSVLLRPLPFPEPERIVAISNHERGSNAPYARFSHPDLVDLVARNHSFERIGGFRALRFVADFGDGQSILVQAAQVTPDMFSLLGVRPVLGRTFTGEDDLPGHPTCILSDAVWRERYGASPNVTRSTIVIDGREHRIIGVMPPGFRFPVQNDPAVLWTTFSVNHEPFPDGSAAYTTQRSGRALSLLGRLKHDRTAVEAAADLSAITLALADEYPESNRRFDSSSVTPWLVSITKDVRPALLMLLGAAACLLLLACVNIANLLLARTSTRQKEIAIRAALGAGRRRILRQLFTESLLLAVLGGAAGFVLAVAGTSHLVALLPVDFPRRSEIAPDVQVFAFTAAVTLLTSFVFGFAPARHSVHSGIAAVLNESSRGSSVSRRTRRLRKSFVVFEIVLSFVLLVGAFFLARTFAHLETAPLGFEPRGLLTLNMSVPDTGRADSRSRIDQAYRALFTRLNDRLVVNGAAAIYPSPISGPRFVADFEIMDRPMHRSQWPRAEVHTVSTNYFATMKVPLLRGRDFDARDTRDAAPTVIVNEKLARTIFGNSDPIGRRIRPGFSDTSVYPPREIVGVVADARSDALGSEPDLQAFLPLPQCVSDQMTLMLRSDSPVETLLPVLHDAIRGASSDAAVDEPITMEEQLRIALAQPRLNSALLSLFAAVAVVLTAIGVYGVMAYSVAQRRHEIGIRLALGAQKLSVFALVLGEGFRLVGIAILAGCACSLFATPLLQRFAYGTAAGTGPMIAAVAAILSAVALLACWMPARRAAAQDPLVAIGQR